MEVSRYTCRLDDGENHCQWYGEVKRIDYYRGNIEISVTGRGSQIVAIIGRSTQNNWICFPEKEYGCSLSSFSDTYWNQDKIADGIGIVDAITVVEALKWLEAEIETYLYN